MGQELVPLNESKMEQVKAVKEPLMMNGSEYTKEGIVTRYPKSIMAIRCPQITIQEQGDNITIYLYHWKWFPSDCSPNGRYSSLNSQGQQKYHPKVGTCVVSACEQLAMYLKPME